MTIRACTFTVDLQGGGQTSEAHRIVGALNKAQLTIAILFGPIFAWWSALSRGELQRALGLLIPATALTVLPLALWIRYRRFWLLVVAGSWWFLVGYYFAVGMWI